MLPLSGNNVPLAAAVLLLNLIPVGSNAYTDFASSWERIKNLPLLGIVCDSGSNLSPTALSKLTLGTRLCAIVADVLVLFATWHGTWRAKRDSDRNHLRTPLLTLLLRDGTIYFIILLGSNVLNIVADGSNVFVFSVTFFTTPISSIILADFLLNIRQIVYSPQNQGLDETGQTEYQSHILGRSLRFQGYGDDNGEEAIHSNTTSDPDMAWEGGIADDGLAAPIHADLGEVGLTLCCSLISLGSDEGFVRAVVNGAASFSAA
ncbi:hypothetical protein CERSUDRAFT_121854 [Gelatoporia subvermispora B]|uniref:Uncharacterized protein n=1 Tax=Ceriporiopsis subvermispora (strain B) TaxID=914234 RepID=M2QRB5_CERS8|nr:hypothetical protein CERSUDRAFT_121854 [Gelatoporia subvermispora B]